MTTRRRIEDNPRMPGQTSKSLASDRPQRWDFWIDRGGTFTDVVGRDAGRHAAPRTSCCRRIPRPIATPPCRASATCSGLQTGEPIPPGRDRRGEDGHDGRHQCAAGAQGRAHAARHHQGLPRRAAHRLPGAAEDLRQADRQARDALRARGRGRRARARRRHGRARARSRRRCAPSSKRAKADGIKAVAIVFMHAYRYPDARAARSRRSRARWASRRSR